MLILIQINDMHISWKQLVQLYEAKMALGLRSSGLYLLSKSTLEHINLTSFSRMRVNLAAQVLS